ncbi:MAG TPA: hypothetical protein VN729_12865, partial [Ktedonobacteraceae bacterium]|nr:hypothetical protein [Ktedonobacteraceae bacterium]
LKTLWLMGVHAVLHVVVFTQFAPCPTCRAYFNGFLRTAAVALTAVLNAAPKATLPFFIPVMTLDVYTSRDQSYDRVFYPGTVIQESDVVDRYSAQDSIVPIPA